MTYAVRKDDMIVNMIVAHESQKEELEKALDATFEDPTECGLTIGDFWNGAHWTRNINGEQVMLEPVIPEPSVEERVTALEESNAEMTEALDMILSGVTE